MVQKAMFESLIGVQKTRVNFVKKNIINIPCAASVSKVTSQTKSMKGVKCLV